MEVLNGKKNGSITVITGNMFAGKTSMLIDEYNRNKNYRRCVVFKPTLDNRYSETKIVSHDKKSVKAIPIQTIQEIEKYKSEADNIYIDELHFFAREDKRGAVNHYLNELANQNKEIVCAGLTWDCFTNEPFLGVSHLMATAEYPIRLFGKCDIENCSERSTKQRWKLDWLPQKPKDFVGGSEKYGSYCRFHYKPVSKNGLNKNTLIIIAGGSGTGKTTVENLLTQDTHIIKLVSTTTRPKREREENGKDYYFISKGEFESELSKGRFLEHVIYDNNYYGIHGKVVDLILRNQNKNGVIIVDVEGMRQLKKYCQEKGYNTISYWFQAESLEKMVEHMQKRGTSDTEIIRRLIIEEKERKFANEFDYILTVKENSLEAVAQKIKTQILKN
ncbi:MAG: thymidine kinase [Mycoplasmataceae bacterium RC_NB112A]|nr:MAG: thymidine kinase [Mycoplasmataceae bacterium RC_NB112A]KLL02451.1 MAG: thymidine kinase [Mycoplasmataceae bacterium RC_NB112A]